MDSIDKILEGVPDKQLRWKGTTSLKWKRELLEYFLDKKIVTTLEIGTNQGWTSYVLSHLSNKVFTVESSHHNYEQAKIHCASLDNIKFILGDAYNDSTYKNTPEFFDLCVVDCRHDYISVRKDIARCLYYAEPDKDLYIAFDDYSHPESTGVRKAIDELLKDDPDITLERYIGHEEGHTVTREDGSTFTLIGPEGLILKYRDEY